MLRISLPTACLLVALSAAAAAGAWTLELSAGAGRALSEDTTWFDSDHEAGHGPLAPLFDTRIAPALGLRAQGPSGRAIRASAELLAWRDRSESGSQLQETWDQTASFGAILVGPAWEWPDRGVHARLGLGYAHAWGDIDQTGIERYTDLHRGEGGLALMLAVGARGRLGDRLALGPTLQWTHAAFEGWRVDLFCLVLSCGWRP